MHGCSSSAALQASQRTRDEAGGLLAQWLRLEQRAAPKGGSLRPTSRRDQRPGDLQVAVGFPKFGFPTCAHSDGGTQDGLPAVQTRPAGSHNWPPAAWPPLSGGRAHVRSARGTGTPGDPARPWTPRDAPTSFREGLRGRRARPRHTVPAPSTRFTEPAHGACASRTHRFHSHPRRTVTSSGPEEQGAEPRAPPLPPSRVMSSSVPDAQ